MEQEEALENAVRSKIERKTANHILNVLEVVLGTELKGLSEGTQLFLVFYSYGKVPFLLYTCIMKMLLRNGYT
jgi:hypothetical protein